MNERDYKKSENARHLSQTVVYDWISGDVSRVPCVMGSMVIGTETADELRVAIAFGVRLRLRVHPENYAAISATHFWFPRNGHWIVFGLLDRTPWPKQVRLLIRHYLLLRLHCTSPLVARYIR